MSTVVESLKSMHNPQGFALIITCDYNDTRDLKILKGTEKDGERMQMAFHRLNFATYWEHNVPRQRLDQLLQETAHCKIYPKECKSIALVFAGHGCQGNLLYMQDGQQIKIDQIVDQFLPRHTHTRHLGDIPKLFFIDACRGNFTMPLVTIPRGGGKQGGEISEVSPSGNFLVAYSTMPRYQSHELPGEGGIWMKVLADKLCTPQMSIDDILTAVNEELMRMYRQPGWPEESKQQPEKFSRLNKIVYLWPGAANREPQEIISGANAGLSMALQSVSAHSSLASLQRVPPTENISRHNGPAEVMYPNTVSSQGRVLSSLLQPDPTMTVPPQPNPHLCTAPGGCSSTPTPSSPPMELQATQFYSSGEANHCYSNSKSNGQLAFILNPHGGISTANAHLRHHLGHQQVTPQYDYIDDGSFGQSRFKCTIKYTTDGHTERVASDGYYPNREDAREEAATKALTKEVSKTIATRGVTPTSSIHKRKLKEYYDKKGLAHRIKYVTKEPPKVGYQSTVFAPEMGYAKGDLCGSEKQAENSAAFHALQKLGVIKQGVIEQ